MGLSIFLVPLACSINRNIITVCVLKKYHQLLEVHITPHQVDTSRLCWPAASLIIHWMQASAISTKVQCSSYKLSDWYVTSHINAMYHKGSPLQMRHTRKILVKKLLSRMITIRSLIFKVNLIKHDLDSFGS